MKKSTTPDDKHREITRRPDGRFATGSGWKKGESGNPRGRKPKHETLTSLYKEEIDKMCPPEADVPLWLKGKTWKELIVIATMRLAVGGNATALKECWERIDGKVAMPTPGAPDEPVNIVVTYDR